MDIYQPIDKIVILLSSEAKNLKTEGRNVNVAWPVNQGLVTK